MISLERMNNGAHFLFVSNILARAEADTNIANKFSKQVNAFRDAVNNENSDLNLSRKSLLTDTITKADSDRDIFYSVYKKTVQKLLKVSNTQIVDSAKVLYQHVMDYNIDIHDQLDKETGMLINFIDDLENKFANEVATLGLGVIVGLLKEANAKVISFTMERTEERMTKTVGSLSASRKASDEAYRELVKVVNAYTIVEGHDNYIDFINYVNTEITHYKREVINKKTSASEEAPADDAQECDE